MNRRLYGALLGALTVLMGTGAALTATGTASAQAPATAQTTTAGHAGPAVTLTARGDSITDGSPFSQVSVDRACPTDYQDNLSVYLVVPDGRETALALNLTAGAPFSGDPVTAQLPAQSGAGVLVRSVSDALHIIGVPLADGVYPVHVVCGNVNHGAFPERPTSTGFISITGSTFQVADLPAPTVTTMTLSASPADHVQVGNSFTLTAKVSPKVAGAVQFTTDHTNPIGAPVPVVDGVAHVTAPANTNPAQRVYVATFLPADPIADAQDVTVFRYSFTAAPAIQVTDADGNALANTPRLTAGQQIQISAQGFLPASQEKVDACVSGAIAQFTPATTDATGAVTGYDLTVPKLIANGTHTLTLTGRTSHVQVAFTFTTNRAS